MCGTKSRMPVRYQMVALLTGGSMINYLDRVNIAVAAPVMMESLGWDEAQFGVIFSAFLLGYALLQFPGGVLADRWNTHRLLILVCVGFSVFTALTPLGQLGFGLMLLLRFSVGMFESVTFPAYAALNARWIPRQEYSRAQTLSVSGAYLGQAIAYPLTTWLLALFSWPVVFYCNALLGGIWLIAWMAFATHKPEEHPRISEHELAYIKDNLAPRSTRTASPWIVAKEPQVLLLALSYLLLIYGLWMIVLWLPTYMVKVRGFTLQQMGWVGVIPTLASFAGLISGGTLSDWLLSRGFSVRMARAQAPSICIALGVPFLVSAVLVESSGNSVLCFATYLFLMNVAGGGYWSVPLEINAQYVGAISGFMNGSGNFAGIFGPITAGFLVAITGNWALPFLVAAGLATLSFVIFFFFVIPKPISMDLRPTQDPIHR